MCIERKSETTVTIFLSSPGDVAAEKEAIKTVARQLAPSFLRHGIVPVTWTFEENSVPAVSRRGETVQGQIDRQMPRKADGSIAYDLFVGIMDRRLGTPLPDAPSGTVHEFLEAKRAFESSGMPHILFYIRERDASEYSADDQTRGVLNFRSEYPGLFAKYSSLEDLTAQFRRHLLTELLDLLQPPAQSHGPQAADGWEAMASAYESIQRGYPASGIDRSAARLGRVWRQLHLLVGIEGRLRAVERRVLAAAILSLLLRAPDREHFYSLAGIHGETADAVRDVADRSLDASKLAVRSVGPVRCDLLGALAAIAPRLDRTGKCFGAGAREPGDLDEWIAFLTQDIVCDRGIVRYDLAAPSLAWIEPLKGATAMAMESLWQRTRNVLTRYGMSFAVSRCGVDLDADFGPLPPGLLESLELRAKEVALSLPPFPHFGEADLPAVERLLPLPWSKVRAPVTFRSRMEGPLRLLVGGVTVAEEAERGFIEYFPAEGCVADCVLECDEAGAYIPVVQARLQRLSAVESSVLDCAGDRADALRSLELWNEVLESVWPGILAGAGADRERLSTAFHILRNAYEEMSAAGGSLLFRRDVYWDALELVRIRLVKSGEAKS